MSAALREAAALMASRLRLFQRTAQQAQEADARIDLAPQELWEPSDQAALDAYEAAINEINGARPLFPLETAS